MRARKGVMFITAFPFRLATPITGFASSPPMNEIVRCHGEFDARRILLGSRNGPNLSIDGISILGGRLDPDKKPANLPNLFIYVTTCFTPGRLASSGPPLHGYNL